MADLAMNAVLVHSSASTAVKSNNSLDRCDTLNDNKDNDHVHEETDQMVVIKGPKPDEGLATVLSQFEHLGFQASNVARAITIAKKMLERQIKSKIFIVKDGKFEEIKPELEAEAEVGEKVYSNVFLGVTANLVGTTCRDAIRFLVKHGVKPRPSPQSTAETLPLNENEEDRIQQMWSADIVAARAQWLEEMRSSSGEGTGAEATPFSMNYRSFLSAMVVSGGGMEHDLRRLCGDVESNLLQVSKENKDKNQYHVTHYSSEVLRSAETASSNNSHLKALNGKFGNVQYSFTTDSLFHLFMIHFAKKLLERQSSLKAAQHSSPAGATAKSDGMPVVCGWSLTPCELWALAGLWLPELLQASATAYAASHEGVAVPSRQQLQPYVEATILYWAVVQAVPVYCPSLVDGDLVHYLLPDPNSGGTETVKLDLVRDIHTLNRFAMQSQHTSIIVCGGGVIKHHLCNANLMRNGADLSIYINNGSEFDGSDGGAKPEEAISWGKIRIDGDYVKVYSEISVILPLLVGAVFIPAIRQREQQQNGQQ